MWRSVRINNFVDRESVGFGPSLLKEETLYHLTFNDGYSVAKGTAASVFLAAKSYTACSTCLNLLDGTASFLGAIRVNDQRRGVNLSRNM